MISFFYLHLLKLKICTNTFMFFPTLALDFLILMILIDTVDTIIKNILETIEICKKLKYTTIKKENKKQSYELGSYPIIKKK